MPCESDFTRKISRVLRSKRDAQRTYDSLSMWYDLLAGSERSFMHAGIDMLDPQQGESILEIGYGTGHGLVRLASAVDQSGSVYGIDISSGMRSVALRRIRQAAMSDRVRLACGDASALPFASGSLDAVFMSFTLELFDTPEIPQVLVECHRVMTAAGRICVVAMAHEDPERLPLQAYEWFHAKLPKYADCRPITLQPFLEQADFHMAESIHSSMWGMPVRITLASKNLA